MNIVGTPYRAVQRSAWTVSMTASGIVAFARDDHARAVRRAGEVAQHHAEAVIEGHGDAHPVLRGGSVHASPMKKPLFRMLWCESVAPLGKPVVPEVYWMLIASSNCSELSRAARSSSGVWRASASRASQSSSSTIDCCRSGQRSRDFGEHANVVGRAERSRQQEHAGARLLEDVGQLGGLVGRVDVDQDRADPGGGVLEDHPLGAVGSPDSDAVAFADAAGEQATRRPRGLLPQLGIGGAVVLMAHDQRFAVAELLDGAAQVLADGLPEQRY